MENKIKTTLYRTLYTITELNNNSNLNSKMKVINPDGGSLNENTNNTTNHLNSDNSVGEEEDNAAVVKKIVFIFMIILILFMCGFIYNIIKCYLPVWLNKRKKAKNDDDLEQSSNNQGPQHYNLDEIEENTI